jgi:hypothetical protein
MTKDKRILIRNTAEVHNPFKMSKFDLEKKINQPKNWYSKKISTITRGYNTIIMVWCCIQNKE